MRCLVVEADGGSRGNPGPAGSGALVFDRDTGEVIAEICDYIGVATNNVAEYRALLAGISAALEVDAGAKLEVRMDSKLVIEQMSGGWKIKHPDMQALAIEIHSLLAGRPVSWVWVPREQNGRADALANEAMDAKTSSIRWHGTSTSPVAQSPRNPASAEFNNLLPSSVRAPQGVTKPLTTVVLVRHGRTALTESKRISGSTGANPGLSDAGWSDARSVAAELERFGKSGPWSHLEPITSIVASPMQRTMDTASSVSTALGGLAVTPMPGFREISFGSWDGLTNEEALAQDPALFEAWRGSWEVSPPGGESLREFDDRIRAARNALLENYVGQTVALVAHVMPIRAMLRFAMAADIEAYWRPVIAPCSITILRFWGDEAAEVLAVNSTAHLTSRLN